VKLDFPAMKMCLLPGLLAGFLPLALAAQTSSSAPLDAATHGPAPALSQPTGKVAPPPGQINVADEPIVKVINNVMPAVVNITGGNRAGGV
jgi:hypothetical protein